MSEHIEIKAEPNACSKINLEFYGCGRSQQVLFFASVITEAASYRLCSSCHSPLHEADLGTVFAK